MKQFHSLKIVGKDRETADSVRIGLDVPDALKAEFAFVAGQHVPLQIERDGKKLRRTYSLCSEAGCWPLEIGVRVQPGGQFSEFAVDELQVGDFIDVMPPNGAFHHDVDADNANHYLGFAAGSGITPILSMMKTILSVEPDSQFSLFYGNRKQNSTMFIEDLFALKNRYPERLQLHFVFSQEDQEFPIASGRLDAGKTRELFAAFCRNGTPDAAFVCGPDTMIADVSAALAELGLAKQDIHAERFGVPRQSARPQAAVSSTGEAQHHITVIMDGHKKTFAMKSGDGSLVDAAAVHGIELPYSCKGGVCATCRTHVREGQVEMAVNYGLEPWELEAGFVLACQCTPCSDSVLLDYDKT